MGARNNRMKKSGLADYGEGYNEQDGYGEMATYGLHYHPIGGDGALSMVTVDDPFFTSFASPPNGLGSYGDVYSTGFNPFTGSVFGEPKVRQIFVPNHVVSAFQNLLQQGGAGTFNVPQMMPQMSMPYPSPMMPPMSYSPPVMMPQMQMPQMGSNCCSMSIQAPSFAPQMPLSMPCSPPMSQPMMPQMPVIQPPLRKMFF